MPSQTAKKLVDFKNGIIKLLDPPFKNKKKVGYITTYPLGVRENGGQYTHGAVWFVMSLFKLNRTEEAHALLNMLNPSLKHQTEEGFKKYKAEPYVIAADVYGGSLSGRGGWTWYTGSASWMYRLLTDYCLGINKNGNRYSFTPCLPKEIKELIFTLKTVEGKAKITIDNTVHEGEWRVFIGGIAYNSNGFIATKSITEKDIILRRKP